MKKLVCALVALFALAAVAGASHLAHAAAGWTCEGEAVKIFRNTDGKPASFAAAGTSAGVGPTFTTRGAFCVVDIRTYHSIGGKGSVPGRVGLERVSGPAGFVSVGPLRAENAGPFLYRDEWYALLPPTPVVIDGTYRCTDSKPATWLSDVAGGEGLCTVYGIRAQGAPLPAPTAKPKASAKQIAKADGHVEIVVTNTGTQLINYVVFRTNKMRLLDAGDPSFDGCTPICGHHVASCTLDNVDQMICAQNVAIRPGRTFSLPNMKTVGPSDMKTVGPNDGGYLWVGYVWVSGTAGGGTVNSPELGVRIDIGGPNGSPPRSPPRITEVSRAKAALELVQLAIAAQREALQDPGDLEAVRESNALLAAAIYHELVGIVDSDLVSARSCVAGLFPISRPPCSAIEEAIFTQNFQLEHNERIEIDALTQALSSTQRAVTEIRTFLAKKR